MGVIKKLKNKVNSSLTQIKDQALDKVAKEADLCQKQIDRICEKKKKYYNLDEHNPSKNAEIINKLLGSIAIEVHHAYLQQIHELYTSIDVLKEFDSQKRISYFDITKWVFDNEENHIDKLVNVYHVLSRDKCNIALIYNRTIEKCNVRLAVVNNEDTPNPNTTGKYKDCLINAIKGNFPGCEYISNNDYYGDPLYSFINSETATIASVTNVASEKSEKFISQSIEKLIDGIVPENSEQEYTIVLLAEPVQNHLELQNELCQYYSALSPFVSWQTNHTFSESNNESASFNLGMNAGIGAGLNLGTGNGNISGQFVSKYENAEIQREKVEIPQVAYNEKRQNQRNGIGFSTNFGVSFNRASSVNITVGKNEGVTQNYTNYSVKHTLDILELQMKRLEQCSALGTWKFAAYVISDDYNTAKRAAHMYFSLTQGENSFISNSAVNIWNSSENQSAKIFESIKKLHHPMFVLNDDLEGDWLMYPEMIDATSIVSGRELAYALNMPRKSVSGFPVIESVSFGREVHKYSDNQDDADSVTIGNIYHLRQKEQSKVELDVNSLCSHTFITGSTGSGKSNTIYHILKELKLKKIKFLVVEPTKGEYKYTFGGEEDVFVYGTNPKLMPLLRMNPFSFPADIHVLEHLDRLIEIFNVCWPMYAAMPAVLKNAVEKAYEDCGWDLTASTNKYGEDMYPTFADVARNVKFIIDSSDYDTDNKGAYKGSLLTRLNSLTNGINGTIFTIDELTNEELFDNNVIIDLSRVGSSETKALIMGMLVLKLQEYRIKPNGTINSDLNHVTVLEEAHNLLKRTSTEHVSESSNLIGKSVEMLSNAIAEMRTYGEGFIIADQAPAMLDMAAIRNTNTKIIMRLPDQSDRELVGKSANLTAAQITELSKLPCGVAAVYQNEWIEPVLCKINKHETNGKKYEYKDHTFPTKKYDYKTALDVAKKLFCPVKLDSNDFSEILSQFKILELTPYIQVCILRILFEPSKKRTTINLAEIISILFPEVKKAVVNASFESIDESKWLIIAESALHACTNNRMIAENTCSNIVRSVITDYIYNDLNDNDRCKKEKIKKCFNEVNYNE